MKFVLQLLKSEIDKYDRSIEGLTAIKIATKDEGYQSAILRETDYLLEFKRAYEILYNISKSNSWQTEFTYFLEHLITNDKEKINLIVAEVERIAGSKKEETNANRE